MGRSERKEADAIKLRDQLREAGDHRGAQVLSALIRSYSSTRETLKRVHRDNMELRQRLGLPSFLDESK